LKSVLVVEDVTLERKLLVEAIRRAGYTVVGVGRGRDAIRQVTEAPEQFGLVLLDMRLPDISGLEVFRGVRHSAPRLKVVLCPGDAESEDTHLALGEGADGCLPKPLDFKQVVGVVTAHIPKS